MSSPLEILGIIPARGGSKGIPRKNIRPLAGKPLLVYTIEAARGSRMLTRCVLSTDDDEIADCGRRHGIEVPFRRPDELAQDDTPGVAVIYHALEWLAVHGSYSPDIIVILQPTAPLRQPHHIDESLQLLIKVGADSVVSVTEVPAHYNPHWQFLIEQGCLRLFTGEPLEQIMRRRQDLPKTYTRNGAIYAFWRRTLQEKGSIYGDRCVAYVMPKMESVNIDSEDDWRLAKELMLR